MVAGLGLDGKVCGCVSLLSLKTNAKWFTFDLIRGSFHTEERNPVALVTHRYKLKVAPLISQREARFECSGTPIPGNVD